MTVRLRSSAGTIVLLLMPQLCVAAEDEFQLVPTEDCRTAFANDEFTIRMRLMSGGKAADVKGGALQWSHSANQRTITRGEAGFQPDGCTGANAEFVLKTPPVRDGVAFTTTVRTEFVPAGADQPVASLERTLTLFPKNPLADRTEWAKELGIELYDPAGTTAKVFEELGLPYRPAGAAGDEPARSSILIIGEGVSLTKRRMLMETTLNAVASGRRAIMLAPSDGGFVLPGAGATDDVKQLFPADIRFAGARVIAEMDRKLDSRSWIGTGNVVPSSRFHLQSYRGRIEAAITDEAPGWPWLRVRYPEKNGAFILCGFRIVEHWDKGPTPRYLLIRILESLAPQSESDSVTSARRSRTFSERQRSVSER